MKKNTGLPIKFDATSNGEFMPPELSRREQQINREAWQQVETQTRRARMDRRGFLRSSCAAAATLMAANRVNAHYGLQDGFYRLSKDADADAAVAAQDLSGSEFIFDIQGHFVDPNGRWLEDLPDSVRPLSSLPNAACDLASQPGTRSYLECLGPERFIRDVFMDSDTDLMVLSFVPSTREREPLTIEEAHATKQIIEQMPGDHRLLIHGRVNPNQAGDLDGMDELAEKWRVAAWKTYTQWGPEGVGFYLHDEKIGVPFIEKARKLGIRNICIHKGIPFGPRSYEHSLCSDIGAVAKAYPDVNFIVYHSGYDPSVEETAFAAGQGKAGIDSLVQSVLDHGVAPNSNVYAELGSTWRFLMRHPVQAAHALGKLVKYVGADNVLWGTDSIWYGSPQDQIQAFRAFQISEKLQEQHGYADLNAELKAKIFGLNACKPYAIQAAEVQRFTATDVVAQMRENYRNNPQPHFNTYGPTTRREFLNLKRWETPV